ncbi:MAG: tRNA (5-methylaminomethyl-2-thiouridine)(34)-methyltransferase MnmD [Chitinophagaceae bacterium]|nr:tRNA (5-methylaminomethyl-2-thiouridine)(34)-methyltransferase MnmD [Chitinophagaceae bacterium]MCU0404094.1 tRNA (5-methylaminomethyl-2-thiouridine)(34)-methyltransferase MnmD [Chitinophagaceae bacterium]
MELDIELMTTADGSHTLRNKTFDVTYHSKFGAIQESRHVFMEAGLHYMANKRSQLKIFEMGFGTGLNALLTLIEGETKHLKIEYTSIETNPLPLSSVKHLNYPEILGKPEISETFLKMHAPVYDEPIDITDHFKLTRINATLQEFTTAEKFDIIYFDAFAPNAQPELWTAGIFSKMKDMMKEGGCLVTYCSKGDVRRAMESVGLSVRKLQGPPGKREMLRAENLPSSL